MDICLNVSSTPVIKKLPTKTVNKSPKFVQKNNSFEFKWDTSQKKIISPFVNRSILKRKNINFQSKDNKTNKIFAQKPVEKTSLLTTVVNVAENNNENKQNQYIKKSTNFKPVKVIENKRTNNIQEPTEKNVINETAKKPDNKRKFNKEPKTDNGHSPTNNTTESYINHGKRVGFPLFNKFSEASRKTIDDEVDVASTEKVFAISGKTFDNLNIHPHTVTNLERIGHTVLTSVQEKAIPTILSGKNVFVRSQTGSGKTLAYAIPIVDSLQSIQPHITRKDGVQAVIVVPTRELALQAYELFLKLVEPFRWIVPGRLCGGENRNSEKARIRKGINILIGTPGRLLDHFLHTHNLKLNKVRCLVLDEADRLLDMGFEKDVNTLVQQIDEAKNCEYDPMELMKSGMKSKEAKSETIPKSKPINSQTPLIDINSKERQTILLSATLTSSVKELASFTMNDYVYIDPVNTDENVDTNTLESAQNREVSVPQSVRQEFVVTDVKARLVVLSAFIVSKASEENCKMFVFMASRQMVEFHEALFKTCLLKKSKKEGKNTANVMIDMDESDSEEDEEEVLDIEFFKLHGSMDQKERVNVFNSFRAAKKGVLLCTDVAARGVDVCGCSCVVQYTAPLQPHDYIHRAGRTGRAQHTGHALLCLTEPELPYIQHLHNMKLFLKREKQDNILKHLMKFMEHVSPASPQAAAEALQRRFEKAVLNDKDLHRAACMAYSSWSRYYNSYPVAMKKFFDFKTAHLGHYVTSFAMKHSPQEVGRLVRSEVRKVPEKRLNKKLDNHESQEPVKKAPLKPKKRPRGQELLVSEFDSGLPSRKKTKGP